MSNVRSVDFNDAAKAVGKKAVASSIQEAVRKGAGKATKKHATPDAEAPSLPKAHYRLSDAGVFYVGVNEDGDQADPVFICSPLKVEAKTRNSQSEEWGRLLAWTDADGHRHQWAAPAEML
ncbi:DUF927 domain-containing protein, partial [Leclercia adecarboxylata]|uniref:DUF927 domain-containing protein n=1 Tax=Leclercia adecarboxylata TaxID=83655 RepID=UPI00234C927F